MPSPSDSLAIQTPVADVTLTIPGPATWKPDTMDLVNQILKLADTPWRFEQVINENGSRHTFARQVDKDYLLYVEPTLPVVIRGDKLKSVTTD